jgi:hypothetical protein
MLKYVVGTVCSVSLASSVYLAGWGPAPAAHRAAHVTETAGMVLAGAADDCCEPEAGGVMTVGPAVGEMPCTHCEEEAARALLMEISAPPEQAAATAPATKPASKAVDAKNTKCVVMPSDSVGDTTIEYKDVVYHLCCENCITNFNNDPDKFVKAFNEDPAKFGVKKEGAK